MMMNGSSGHAISSIDVGGGLGVSYRAAQDSPPDVADYVAVIREALRDFHGRIDLGGRYRGNVTFAAPRALLTHVLLSIGESDYTDASHRDIVGEIANQMSGQARRHFGEAMDISPPRVIDRDQARHEANQHQAQGMAPFVIPVQWDRYEAHLVVQMEQGIPP